METADKYFVQSLQLFLHSANQSILLNFCELNWLLNKLCPSRVCSPDSISDISDRLQNPKYNPWKTVGKLLIYHCTLQLATLWMLNQARINEEMYTWLSILPQK